MFFLMHEPDLVTVIHANLAAVGSDGREISVDIKGGCGRRGRGEPLHTGSRLQHVFRVHLFFSCTRHIQRDLFMHEA